MKLLTREEKQKLRAKKKERKDKWNDRLAERCRLQRENAAKAKSDSNNCLHSGRPEDRECEIESVPSQVPNHPSTGRKYTVSIALPSSIVDNAQSQELKTYLVGQVARAAVIFQVDEIVVFDEYSCSDPNDNRKRSVAFMSKILQYLECPQYLRKHFFPLQKDLQFAGLLNPLDCQHHLKIKDLHVAYREAVVLDKQSQDENSNGSFVYMGLDQEAQIDKPIQPGVRVTVHFDPSKLQPSYSKDHIVNVKRRRSIKAKVVSPSEPRTKSGLYWGYSVRTADSLSQALDDCPFAEEYDLKIGTSERGDTVQSFVNSDDGKKFLPKFNHAIVVFGGLKGLEAALDADPKLQYVRDMRHLFHTYLNTCPDQGSNTIRTEEAILITLSVLRPFLKK